MPFFLPPRLSKFVPGNGFDEHDVQAFVQGFLEEPDFEEDQEENNKAEGSEVPIRPKRWKCNPCYFD